MSRARLYHVLLIAGLALMAACVPGYQWRDHGSPPAGKPPATQDTFVWVSLFEPDKLNPLSTSLVQSKRVMDLLFDGLVTFDDKLEIVPELAQRWEISPDGLAYTFTLRPNAKWHDGRPATSADVKFTYDAIRDPSVPNTIA